MSALLAGVLAAAAVLLWWQAPATSWRPEVREARRGPGGGARPGPGTDGGPSDVPEAMELLALAVHGGVSLGEAVVQVSGVLPGRRREELLGVGRALLVGADAGGAWAAAGPDWEPARRALELAAVAGVAPAQALRQAAADLRADLVADVQLSTARLGVRLVLPLGLTFLPAFVLTSVLPLVLALMGELAW